MAIQGSICLINYYDLQKKTYKMKLDLKILHNTLMLLLIIGVVACGNRTSITTAPEPDDVVEENNPPSVTIETFTGADPNALENVPTETEEIKVEGDAEAIEWLDFETAIDRNKIERKFIFIDMYTDWCSWCKKMDGSTFKSPSVINYIDKHFYAVKMNPESKEAIAYKDVLYEQKAYGNKMYNELAVNLLGGKMSFPSYVILNKREVKRGVIVGYQKPSQLISALKHYVE